jgi:hypothetical protein
MDLVETLMDIIVVSIVLDSPKLLSSWRGNSQPLSGASIVPFSHQLHRKISVVHTVTYNNHEVHSYSIRRNGRCYSNDRTSLVYTANYLESHSVY